ncbi:MAG: phytanoyl-CoA dioxygenase family protein [Gammaproteobacteria bacterium]|nr:phytanoyl-CoA dioxygenase family protein [Gammaproteobacteria bacterium]
MSNRLTQFEVDQFAELGYLSSTKCLTDAECDALLEHIESFERDRPDDVGWAFDLKTNLLFDWVYALGAHKAILEIAEDLLGPNLFNTNSIFRIKESSTGTHYGWHQDAARIEVEPCFVIAFVSLTDSTKENGCLQVIPGSHKRIHPFDVIENADGQPQRRVARTKDVDESKAELLELKAGEVAFFSGRLVHGSGSNTSSERRIAVLTDYTAADAKQSVGQGSGQLVCGEDNWRYIAPEPVPQGNCTSVDVLNRRRVLTTYPENPLMGPLQPGQAIEFPDAPDHESNKLGIAL